MYAVQLRTLPEALTGSRSWRYPVRQLIPPGYPGLSTTRGQTSSEQNLDGTTTEYFEVEPSEATLLAILRGLFEKNWRELIFGPCIQGAVFEGRFVTPPRLTTLDGYVTVSAAGDGPWHFHLCIGPHRGTRNRPTPPELAAWRRCARAAFFRDRDRNGRQSVWGFRMWNGRGEQMITIFFPNPWLDPVRMRPVRAPEWSRLDLWMRMRRRWAGVAPEPPPLPATPPRLH